MRKWFVLLIALLAFTSAVYAQSASLDATITAIASLRSGPGTQWRRIATLPAGTNIRLDGKAPGGGWVRGVTQDNQQGWVVDTAVNLSADQIATLPNKNQSDPFTAGAPAGAAPTAAPANTTNNPANPAANSAPVTNLAPLTGFQYGGQVNGFGQNTINQMHHAGMTWVKRQVQALQDYAAPINEAHGSGFHILLSMIGDVPSLSNDGYFDQFAQSAAHAAAEGADAIEVWNEPNIDAEWPSGQISAARYTQLLAKAYQAIKAANPATLVISAAPAPTGYFGGCSAAGCDDDQFVAGMYAAGAANDMDCLGTHYNEGVLPPTATSGDPRGSSSYYTRYYSGMVNTYYNAFHGKKPLCFTEFGYLTPEGYPPLPGAFGWAQNVTVADQASWLAQAISMASRSGKVRLFIIWNIDFTEYGSDPQAGYAIIRPGGGCPTCDALAH